jgi:hypothetical protein
VTAAVAELVARLEVLSARLMRGEALAPRLLDEAAQEVEKVGVDATDEERVVLLGRVSLVQRAIEAAQVSLGAQAQRLGHGRRAMRGYSRVVGAR